MLSGNQNACHLIEAMIELDPKQLDILNLGLNQQACHFIISKDTPLHAIDPEWFANREVIYYLWENPDVQQGNLNRDQWWNLSLKPSDAAVQLLKRFPENIYWCFLCANTHPEAFAMLKQNMDKVSWTYLSINPLAISMIEKQLKDNPSTISWEVLCANTKAIHLIENNLNNMQSNLSSLEWHMLSSNPRAMHLLEKHPHLIDHLIWANESIFEYDYEQIKLRFYKTFGTELIQKLWHPSNMEKGKGWKVDDDHE